MSIKGWLPRWVHTFSMLVSHQHCCLCGIKLFGLKRRFQSPANTAAFVAKHCKPTPFIYPLLSSESGGGDSSVSKSGQQSCKRRSMLRGVCIPCVNWKRRVETCGLKRSKHPMLQLDQLICFLMQPGYHVEPDHRCMERLVMAAQQPDNPFRSFFPVAVQTILDAAKAPTSQACVYAWWEYNGCTEFMASGPEARRVRCVVKAVEGGHQGI